MKKILFISILIFCNALSAQHADSLFVQANKLYQIEKYDEALQLYKEIEKNNVQSDELFYNIANANYKLNRIASAIYYYEKSLLLDPNNEDAKFNLGFAKRMALDNIEPLPKNISQKISAGIIQRLSYDIWAWLTVIFSFLFAILFLLSWLTVIFSFLFAIMFLLYHFSYSSRSKRFYFVSSSICALLAFITLAFSYNNFNYVKTNKYAIIFAQESDVKSAPTLSSEVSFELHEGTKVLILESLDNWKKIKIDDGKIGWMVADDLKELQ